MNVLILINVPLVLDTFISICCVNKFMRQSLVNICAARIHKRVPVSLYFRALKYKF